MLSRVARLEGYRVAAMDITYWETYAKRRPSMNNPLDLLGDAGFAFLSLNCRQTFNLRSHLPGRDKQTHITPPIQVGPR